VKKSESASVAVVIRSVLFQLTKRSKTARMKTVKMRMKKKRRRLASSTIID